MTQDCTSLAVSASAGSLTKGAFSGHTAKAAAGFVLVTIISTTRRKAKGLTDTDGLHFSDLVLNNLQLIFLLTREFL